MSVAGQALSATTGRGMNSGDWNAQCLVARAVMMSRGSGAAHVDEHVCVGGAELRTAPRNAAAGNVGCQRGGIAREPLIGRVEGVDHEC